MSRAKPAYDSDGSWKHKNFGPAEWEALAVRLRKKLRPLYPDKKAVVDETFGHPSDSWVNYLLSEANGAVSIMLSLRLRLTNEQLRAEREDLLNTLNKAVRGLSTVSQDLDILFGVDADVLGTRDKIQELIPFIEGSRKKIAELPRAINVKDAKNAAAVEMAIRCLRVFKGAGGKVAATASDYSNYESDAIKVLQILGDELGLELKPATWKRVIADARRKVADLQ